MFRIEYIFDKLDSPQKIDNLKVCLKKIDEVDNVIYNKITKTIIIYSKKKKINEILLKYAANIADAHFRCKTGNIY